MAKKISVKQNWLDRMVGYVSPTRGAARLKARTTMALANSYNGASRSNRAFSEWVTSAGDSDEDVIQDLPHLRERSRDLVRNNPLAGGAINTKVTSIIGTGLRVKSQIDHEFIGITEEQAQRFQQQAERHFKIWSNSVECDCARRLNFSQMQALALRSTFENGDCFALLPYFDRSGSDFETKIQLIEGDLVSNPNHDYDTPKITGGIEKDSNGAPYRAHISNVHPGSPLSIGEIKWQPRRFFDNSGRPRLLHVYHHLRIGQTRGVPDLAPVIEALKQLGRYTDAELMAAVISGMFTVFITTPEGDADLAINSPDSTTQKSDDAYKLGNGAMVGLAEGESISTANPGRPNDKFDPFVLAILRQIGIGLELPYELLIKHFTASYSASRAALLEAWRMFKTRRQWFAAQFCQPIYEQVITEAVSKGWISAPGYLTSESLRSAYLQTVWTGDAPGQLDPLKEANAAKSRIENNLSTEARETMELTGGDWELDQRQRKKERERHQADGTKAETSALPAKEAEEEGNEDEDK